MKLSLPLVVEIPRRTREDKRVILNLNVYRNMHHFTLNAAKKETGLHVALALGEANYPSNPLTSGPYRFTYTIFPGSGRAFDLGNVCSVVDKFTADALIELGVIKDDNYKVVREINYRFGAIDKDHPRAELLIESI